MILLGPCGPGADESSMAGMAAEAPPIADLPSGRFGRYTLQEQVGKGGMAVVFRALEDRAGGGRREVALKVIHPHLSGDGQLLSGLRNEARIGIWLRHPNIIEVYEFSAVKRRYFLSMEYLQGVTLDRMTFRCRNHEHDLSPGAFLDILTQGGRGAALRPPLRGARRPAQPDPPRPQALQHPCSPPPGW